VQEISELKEEIVERLEERARIAVDQQPEVAFARSFQLTAESLGLSENFTNFYLQNRSFVLFEEMFFVGAISIDEIISIAEIEANLCKKVLTKFVHHNTKCTVALSEETIAKILSS